MICLRYEVISLAGERVKETIPSLQLSYPVPVNRLTPDNKMKALTAASVNNNAGQRTDGGTKPEFVSHPELPVIISDAW